MGFFFDVCAQGFMVIITHDKPPFTVAGYMIAGSIGSTVIVEQVFSLPGIGGLLISAIEENNFPIVQILVLFMLGAYLVMSFVIDILYTVLDPRVDLK